MPNYFADKKFYLSSPIEHGNDSINWRPKVIEALSSEFKMNVFDPFADPKQQWALPLKKAQEECNYDEMTRIAKSFVRKDLSSVQDSKGLIAYLPYKIPTVGCCHEIINAVNNKIPTLLVSESKNKIPLWYYGIMPHEFMFGCWEDLYQYLREVNLNMHLDNNRWDVICGRV